MTAPGGATTTLQLDRVRPGDVVEVQPTRDRTCGTATRGQIACGLPAGHASDPGPAGEVHADVSLSGLVLQVWPVLGDDELDDEDGWA